MKKIIFFIKYFYLLIKYIIIDKELDKIQIINNKDCVILWNWPSLNESLKNKVFLKNKYIIAVNNFIKSDLFVEIKPNFYVISDSWFWENNSIKNNKNSIDENVIKNSNRLNDLKSSFINNLITKVDWEMILFLPLHANISIPFKEVIEKNKYIKICYYIMNPINIKSNFIRNFLYKYNFWMPTAQTVLISAIFIALNINFKNIYILWWDHSWHEDFFIDNNNILYTKDKHFYDNWFNLIPIISDWKNHSKFHEEFLSLYKAFKWHILLEEYSKHLNAKIYNASEKSYIDAYKRYKI